MKQALRKIGVKKIRKQIEPDYTLLRSNCFSTYVNLDFSGFSKGVRQGYG
jgi:hypothetical protein